MISIVRGDLLSADVDALVNAVNCVGVMGKGIALQFKKTYPLMFQAYHKACEAGEVVPGRMHVYTIGSSTRPRFIINFPTKRHWKYPSKMIDIESGLVDLVAITRELGIRSIAIPPLGCGNGGLSWVDVQPKIKQAFAPLNDVQVLIFEPIANAKFS